MPSIFLTPRLKPRPRVGVVAAAATGPGRHPPMHSRHFRVSKRVVVDYDEVAGEWVVKVNVKPCRLSEVVRAVQNTKPEDAALDAEDTFGASIDRPTATGSNFLFEKETLIHALQHPELYPNMRVVVVGYGPSGTIKVPNVDAPDLMRRLL